MERTRSSQYNSQCIALQMKLSEEKVSKSTNRTMAALAAAHPPAPVDLPPVLPPRSDNGYGEFLARYQADMKQLDDQLTALTSRYQQASAEWVIRLYVFSCRLLAKKSIGNTSRSLSRKLLPCVTKRTKQSSRFVKLHFHGDSQERPSRVWKAPTKQRRRN